jgi:hypothetical protein
VISLLEKAQEVSMPAPTHGFARIGKSSVTTRMFPISEPATDVIVVGGAFAIVVTLTLHVVYSYERTPATGWLMDAYPRY